MEYARSLIPDEIQQYEGDGLHKLLKLMVWFKKDFFKYAGIPKCKSCNTSDHMLVNQATSQQELEKNQWEASKAEIYACKVCCHVTKLTRFKDPLKILHNKIGNNLEWAIAFTTLCLALGCDARLCVDDMDEAFTEIHIDNRWVHFDSHMQLYDSPLVYE